MLFSCSGLPPSSSISTGRECVCAHRGWECRLVPLSYRAGKPLRNCRLGAILLQACSKTEHALQISNLNHVSQPLSDSSTFPF